MGGDGRATVRTLAAFSAFINAKYAFMCGSDATELNVASPSPRTSH